MNAEFVSNNIDYVSLLHVLEDSQQVMIYGWRRHCHYSAVLSSVESRIFKENLKPSSNFPLKKHICAHTTHTWEGRIIENIQDGQILDKNYKKYWQEGLTKIILENCKRKRLNMPLIRLLFCIDIDGNPYPFQVAAAASKSKEDNERITNAEMRRCYKLCTQLNPEVNAVALSTIKFVKLTYNSYNKSCSFQLIPHFWDTPEWTRAWRSHKEGKSHTQNHRSEWQTLFLDKLQAFSAVSTLP